MLTKRPLVSIVTPSYNHGQFIEETVRSVLSQDYQNIEYIVMDGGSTDNTVDLLRKYGNKIRWVSGPDQGQADAVNKGFNMATGEILGWLNSDDTYHPGAVHTVVKYFLTNPESVMIYGDANFIDKEGQIIGKYPSEPFNPKRLHETCFICQPTVFIRREVVEKVGLLDLHLETCMDYDYWIRISKYFDPGRVTYLEKQFLGNSRRYGENKTFRMRRRVYKEVMRTQKKHFGKISRSWILGYIQEILLGRRSKP
ncbi:MAG: glycosyltransferase family 2 protein [Thermodesulfobacteriota bacterium]|jgi:glycosyltransferase involved in cell wall biosynthesis